MEMLNSRHTSTASRDTEAQFQFSIGDAELINWVLNAKVKVLPEFQFSIGDAHLRAHRRRPERTERFNSLLEMREAVESWQHYGIFNWLQFSIGDVDDDPVWSSVATHLRHGFNSLFGDA